MSMVEAKMWRAYMARRGTLNIGLRLEQGFALLASYIHQAHFTAPHPTMEHLMPHVLAADDESDPLSGMKEVFKLLTDRAPRGAVPKPPKVQG
jgi:hypothetical protein